MAGATPTLVVSAPDVRGYDVNALPVVEQILAVAAVIHGSLLAPAVTLPPSGGSG